MIDWHTEELNPKCDVVVAATPGPSLTVNVTNPDYFVDGDMVAFPGTGDRAYVVGIKGSTLALDSRHARLVTQRWIGSEKRWNGDDWISVDLYEPLAIPHWQVRNIRPRQGDELLVIGSRYLA